MKSFFLKYGHVLAALSLLVAAHSANLACSFRLHQDEEPEAVKSLRKF